MTDRQEYMRQYMQRARAQGKYKDTRTRAQGNMTARRQGQLQAAKERYIKARNLPSGKQLKYPFWGCDGEGAGRGEDHIYWILRVGPHVLMNKDGSDLTTQQCLTFLADLGATQPKCQAVSFFFDYDITMILRGLPLKAAQQFLAPNGYCVTCKHKRDYHIQRGQCIECDCESFRPGGIATFYPSVDGRKSYRPIVVSQLGSSFSVKWSGKPAFTIEDTAGFFQTAFVKTLTLWEVGRPELHRHLQRMKDQRSEFMPGEDLKAIAQYNELECRLLEKLMGKLRYACKSLDLVPRRWLGAGYLASAMLVKAGVPVASQCDIPDAIKLVGELGYFGGRFESFRFGSAFDVHSYDIASAYPHAYTQLPCLVEGHGHWRSCLYDERQSDNGIWPVKTFCPYEVRLAPFPHRDSKGRITYPTCTDGWYWGPEITAAISYNIWVPDLVISVIEPGYEWVSECDHKPGEFTEHWYGERLKLGKASMGLILKLGLNSLYGKAAQRIGSPPWGNIVWAGLITSITRARLLEAATFIGPDNIISFQTDGLYSTVPGSFDAVDAPAKGALGDWEHEPADELFLAQSGVYAVRRGDDWTCHSRGFPFKSMRAALPELIERFPKEGWSLKADLPKRDQFITLRLAVDRGKPDKAGTWEVQDRVIDFSANADKRHLHPDLITTSLLVSRDGAVRSAPYDDRVAALVSALLESAWSEALTPDGPLDVIG